MTGNLELSASRTVALRRRDRQRRLPASAAEVVTANGIDLKSACVGERREHIPDGGGARLAPPDDVDLVVRRIEG
jgi:hypothetical protein